MGKSDVGDDNYLSTVLKINVYTGTVSFLGHRPKPLHFFTVHSLEPRAHGKLNQEYYQYTKPFVNIIIVLKLKFYMLSWKYLLVLLAWVY
jgi:hypothetical protein